MSFTDRLVLWLHVAFVVFTIGPVTVAIMSSPRVIRNRNTVILRYLLRTTRIFTIGAIGVLIFGVILGEQLKEMGRAWLTASMTLFVVALVLLVLIMRDQRRAISALTAAAAPAAIEVSEEPDSESTAEAGEPPSPPSDADLAHIATVERGRIASIGGVVSLIWLVILVLMIWQP